MRAHYPTSLKADDPIIQKAIAALEHGDMVVYSTDGCKMYVQQIQSHGCLRYTVTCDEESGAEPCAPECDHEDNNFRSEYLLARSAMLQDLEIIDNGKIAIRRRTPIENQLSDEEVIEVLGRLGADLGIIEDAQKNGWPLHLWLLDKLDA